SSRGAVWPPSASVVSPQTAISLPPSLPPPPHPPAAIEAVSAAASVNRRFASFTCSLLVSGFERRAPPHGVSNADTPPLRMARSLQFRAPESVVGRLRRRQGFARVSGVGALAAF